ncbi:MAG: DNA mismatch repair endonuclease MutL [Lachnospiraceae bacterium]|nr:DNA mismatch repair endonuclease MutL [Lachnospiraceae bacterium]
MPIHVLDKKTIDKIAAGEVVERPASVVKELVENALDAGATAVTVEIQNGGIDLIRVTDNGCGIPEEEVRTAFLPHATSKITSAEDLFSIQSLGFRGEALSSIASVTQLEVITKTGSSLNGISLELSGGDETGFSEIGAPNGTTFLVRNLFFNTPARKKFLKTAVTEASYVGTLMEHMALSHPDVSFHFLANGRMRLQTSGNGKVKDLVYSLYGRETASRLISIDYEEDGISVSGFLGKPEINKGNRGFENYFVNGRYVKSRIIDKACEDAYEPFLMQHMYPFFVLYINLPPSDFDVNVHPQKTELRFNKEAELYDILKKAVHEALYRVEMIPEDVDRLKDEPTGNTSGKTEKSFRYAEPFETERVKEEGRYGPAGPQKGEQRSAVPGKTPYEAPGSGKAEHETGDPRKSEHESPDPGSPDHEMPASGIPPLRRSNDLLDKFRKNRMDDDQPGDMPAGSEKGTSPGTNRAGSLFSEDNFREQFRGQMDLLSEKLISDEGMKKHRLIGQVFDTYWLLQMEDKLYIMDQHAAHEKVNYERMMAAYREKKASSQIVSPPVMVSLSQREELILNRYMDAFSALGYEISSFGGREYVISAVPADLYGVDMKALFREILAEMEEELPGGTPEIIHSKLASASCKAAVKGGNRLSFEEAEALLQELLTLENPYACPHGRPTMISLSRNELEKRFKRIV